MPEAPVIQTTLNMLYRPTFIVYGPGKVGKTYTCASTAPAPFVLNTDRGVESLRKLDIPYATISDTRQLDWFFQQAEGPFKGKYKTLILDDFTEVGDMFIRECDAGIHVNESGKAIKGKQIYGELGRFALPFIHRFRRLAELGYYVVLICKETKFQDSLTGATLRGPNFPGNVIKDLLDHLLSEIYHVELWTDPATQQVHRTVRTKRTNQLAAGSRCGDLAEIEFLNLSAIFAKMEG